MMCTCTHKRPVFQYKAKTDITRQWEPNQVPTATLKASFGAILSVVDLHGWHMNFSLHANMIGFCSDGHILGKFLELTHIP